MYQRGGWKGELEVQSRSWPGKSRHRFARWQHAVNFQFSIFALEKLVWMIPLRRTVKKLWDDDFGHGALGIS